jgi:UDP-N-acetylmuramate--alanine ligase
VLKRADFLGSLMEGKTGIAVAGTHGKTTTASMIAWMLAVLRQNPSFIIGGVLANLGVNAQTGEGNTFVIEADEYDRMFLGLKPAIEVVTSVEHDHPDCYPTPADYQAAFVEFVKRLPADGRLVACAEDAGVRALIADANKLNKAVITYGVQPKAEDQQGIDVYASALAINDKGGFTFDAEVLDTAVTVELQVPGKHNVSNALAALTVAKLLNLPLAEAALALGQFIGTGRRFEVRGEAGGVVVVDDYAHHPTEIRATLAAARIRYPGRRIWAVWQPHTYSRTQMLFDDFVHSFSDADEIIVTEVYAAREPKQDFSSRQIVDAMPRPAHFIAGLSDVSNFLTSHLRPGDALLVLSAGDADQVSAEVLAHLKEISNAKTNG